MTIRDDLSRLAEEWERRARNTLILRRVPKQKILEKCAIDVRELLADPRFAAHPESAPAPGTDARRLPDGTLVTCEHSRFPHPKGDDGRECLFPKVAAPAPGEDGDQCQFEVWLGRAAFRCRRREGHRGCHEYEIVDTNTFELSADRLTRDLADSENEARALLARVREQDQRLTKAREALRETVNGRCFDHEDACCREWCKMCQREVKVVDAARSLLSEFDALVSRSEGQEARAEGIEEAARVVEASIIGTSHDGMLRRVVSRIRALAPPSPEPERGQEHRPALGTCDYPAPPHGRPHTLLPTCRNWRPETDR